MKLNKLKNIRELREESGLVVLPVNLEKIAVIDFEFMGDPVILEVHLFTSTKYEGHPFETEGKLWKILVWHSFVIPFLDLQGVQCASFLQPTTKN